MDPEWQAVFTESAKGLRAFLAKRIDQPADVEDCLQTVFLKAIQSGSQLPPHVRKAWLFRVATNESINFWRQRETSRKYIEHIAEPLAGDADQDFQELQQRETHQLIEQQLRELPESTQEIIQRKFDGEQTFQQIANDMNLPLGTVLTRMRRGLEKLRQKLNHPFK